MISSVSPRTQRQVDTYVWLLPQLRTEDVDLNAIPGILELTVRNAKTCQGGGFLEAAERLNAWIRANDYEALYAHLTDPSEENEPLRVVSPLISVFWRRTAPTTPRITRENLVTPVRG